MTWIQTATGRKIFPLDPRPEHICIEDIAHALAMKCRFSGHCWKFYSVAEHSWRCVAAEFFLPITSAARNEAIALLLHDAAEAYLPDVPRPIKADAAFTIGGETVPFKMVEVRLLRAIELALGVEILRHDDLVKRVDLMLLATEARDLMNVPVNGWQGLPEPMREVIRPWSPEGAKDRFLEIWSTLTAGGGA